MINFFNIRFSLVWTPFQINRDFPNSTVEQIEPRRKGKQLASQPRWLIQWLEVLLIFLIFAMLAGRTAPHVNEAHYLTKAKHFWNPEWCPHDLFLSSANAHGLFYFCFGWLTQLLSLEGVAWVGRIGTWFAMAWAWQRLTWRLIATPFAATLTAAMFFLLNERFHLAGEWVVGGFEAKSVAYVLLVWALAELAASRWNWVWPILGLAAAMHLLVGGWAIVAVSWVWLVERRRWLNFRLRRSASGGEWMRDAVAGVKSQAWAILLAIGLVTVGLIPPLMADWRTPQVILDQANEIYVHRRLSHHLLLGQFPTANIARFTGLICVWFVLFRWCEQNYRQFAATFFQFFQFGLASLLIALVGLFLSGIADQGGVGDKLASSLLRFYWFRLSDFAIPATGALMLGWLMVQWWSQPREQARRFSAGLAAIMIGAATVALAMEHHADPRPVADQRALPQFPQQPEKELQYYDKWRQVCQWISQNTPTDATFITPHQQQTFKWYAHRSEVVNWKDVPQNAESMLQWWQRVDELIVPQQRFELGLMSYSDEQLSDLAHRYQAKYLIVPQWQVEKATPTSLKRVYPQSKSSKSAFVVFEFSVGS